MKPYIYLTINLINNKKYIGQHNGKKKNYIGSGIALKKAIKKYGKKNFKLHILEYVEDLSKLDEREIFYINLFNAVKSKDFYNMAEGGLNCGRTIPSNILHHACVPIYELDVINKKIIKEFSSVREASIFYSLNEKGINRVITKRCKSYKGKVFIRKKDFYNIEWNFYIIKHSTFSYMYLKTNEIFKNRKELWEKHFKNFMANNTFNSKLSELIKLKIIKKVSNQYITHR